MKRAIILGSSAAVILASGISVVSVRRFIGGKWRRARRGVHRRSLLLCRIGAGRDRRRRRNERVTLDPDQYVGPVKQAYQVAEKSPALLAQLHCYCGCDRTLGHQNLLDCYRGDHASKCEICVGEALMAEQLSEQGSPVEQIRDALRRHYAGEN